MGVKDSRFRVLLVLPDRKLSIFSDLLLLWSLIRELAVKLIKRVRWFHCFISFVSCEKL